VLIHLTSGSGMVKSSYLYLICATQHHIFQILVFF